MHCKTGYYYGSVAEIRVGFSVTILRVAFGRRHFLFVFLKLLISNCGGTKFGCDVAVTS